MKITITGMPGAGKSTLAKNLAEKLKLKRYYMGGMRREIARKKGMTLEELNKLGETDYSTDKEVDDFQKDLGNKEDDFIIEGRTSFFLVPGSIKIFVDVDSDEGAKRVFRDIQNKNLAKQRNETDASTIQGVKESIKNRIRSDIFRYKKYYGIDDVYDKSHYDIIIDTTGNTPEQDLKQALDKLNKFLKAQKR
jgi:CMP/dCMP kinase